MTRNIKAEKITKNKNCNEGPHDGKETTMILACFTPHSYIATST